MSTDETNYGFEQKTIDDYRSQKGSYLEDDNVKIIKFNSELQFKKMTKEPVDLTEKKEGVEPSYKEIGQFLYMDVGRWGGDKDTGDAWTRRRNFGLVCGSCAILCNYDGKKGSSISNDPNLENIYPEVWEHPDIQKMKPLLEKLSESNRLGHVTVVNALVCTDEISEAPSSEEILIFLGDIHAPVMNARDRIYLQDSLIYKSRERFHGNIEAWCRGRIKIDSRFAKIEMVVARFLENIEKIESKANMKDESKTNMKDITELLKKTLEDLFESQQLNSLDNKIKLNDKIELKESYTLKALEIISEISPDSQQRNKWDNNEKIVEKNALYWSRLLENNGKIKWNDTSTIKVLKILLEHSLKSQQLSKWDNNERITEDDALCWFNLYHGYGTHRGVDIFQSAGEDLCEFLKLLLEYQKDYQKLGSVQVKLTQLGDLYDFWLGLKRAFYTMDPQKMFSDSATHSFLEFWQKEALHNTSVSKAIYHLLKGTKALCPSFVYGNHDSYRATPQWPDNDDKPLDHFESLGVWAEHGHQSDAFNEDSNAVIGWSAAVFGFFDPEARNFEPYLRGAETWAFRKLCRRLTCIRHAAYQCQMKNKRIYIMGHTHEPLLKKVLIVEQY
ncbi:MAG: hypothetical protein RBT65_16240 [Methanolobus sp.]|nr:hypothetical protein [Methanolobus sp.]